MHSTLAVLAVLCVSAHAQWLKIPTPGLPRTPDGKPNLTAPAPKTPDGRLDISGMWQVNAKYLFDVAADLKPGEVPFQPWALAVFNDRKEGGRPKDDPAARCLPGMPKLDALPYPFKIVVIPGMVVILYEGFTTYRQIFTDGRPLPKDPQPAWLGYSVGKWDAGELVVETIGINASTWMDNSGHPHSEALHLTERFRRKDVGRLEIQITVDDPKAYTKPWTFTEEARLVPDTELLEYICSENDKDFEHLVGK